MELHELTAISTAAAVRRREVSVREVTEHALARAEQLSAAVGAFVHLTPEHALAQADALDRRLAAGDGELPLVGVPCPIKDLNQVRGLPYECGSATLAGNLASLDDGVASWLAEAGTVMIGKTNTPEFGLPCYTEPDNAPPARTPWDLRRSAGGSSGGAAAAVASGIVPIAQGSDGGGSIRIPASACGLVGLKASRGRVSPGPFAEAGPGFATNGMLTRTVRDTALALDVLAARHEGDTYIAPGGGRPWRGSAICGGVRAVGETRTHTQPPASFLAACDAPVPRLRVGVLTRPVIAETAVHPACLDAVARTVALLGELGHEVDEAPTPMEVGQWDAFAALWSVGAAAIPVPPEKEALLRPLTRWLRTEGRRVTGVELAGALDAAQRLTRQVASAWDGFDVILTPTLAQPPALIGELRDDADPAGDFAAQTRFTPWTSVYNMTGRPAISLPLHTAMIDGCELPIGVMLGARLGDEATLLALAAQLEAAAPWRHPQVDGRSTAS